MKSLLAKNRSSIPQELSIDGVTYSGSDLADKLNAHFLTSGILGSSCANSPNVEFLMDRVEESIFLQPTTLHEIAIERWLRKWL